MTRIALVVGINDYKEFPLYGSVNDAKIIADLLEYNEGGSPNCNQVDLLTSPKVTGQKDFIGQGMLKSKISQFFSSEADVAIFYFSGHGIRNDTGGYIVTSDYSLQQPGVSMEDILTIAKKSKIKNKIIILDCCHSGCFGNKDDALNDNSEIPDGMTILTASRSDEGAFERDSQGVFTSLLIGALEGEAADLTGNITPGSLYAYIDRGIGAIGQRPVFKTNIKRFVSIRQVKPSIDQKLLKKIPSLFPDPMKEHKLYPSYEPTHKDAELKNTEKLSTLQKFVQAGLVKPVGEEHMYYAAINSKSCRLTALGKQYWKLQSTSNKMT